MYVHYLHIIPVHNYIKIMYAHNFDTIHVHNNMMYAHDFTMIP